MAGIQTDTTGFTDTSRDTFQVDWSKSPIDRLSPGSEHHGFVLNYLNRRIQNSEKSMSNFYNRWRIQERKCQGYIDLPAQEAILKAMNDRSKLPQPAAITFPYMFATISTIVTYLGRVFCNRKPVLAVSPPRNLPPNGLQAMEALIQHQAEYMKLVMRLFQFFMDGELYGLAIMRNLWATEVGQRTLWQPPSKIQTLLGHNQPQRTVVERTTFEGNEVDNIDPFMFFPDPNVPMAEVATKGEYIAWRQYMGRSILLMQESLGKVKYVSDIRPEELKFDSAWFDHSNRNLKAEGRSGGRNSLQDMSLGYQVDQGSFVIIPADLGLGPGYKPEKWLFTIIGKTQIIQAEPLALDHGRHPIIVAEPYTQGYGFGQIGISDMLGPLQDLMSWLVDSRIFNIRSVLNNMLVVDPGMVDMQDFRRPGPGKLIRLKPQAMGKDVRTAIYQLPMQDVTQNHMSMVPLIIRIGDAIAAVNDNMRGQEESGDRITATQSRISGEAAVSRMGKHATIYSSQAISELARQQVMNNQQFISLEMLQYICGQDITPDMISGEFMFPVHDGSLPFDKVGLQQAIINVLQAAMKDPELRAKYAVDKIFELAAEMSGFLNISQYRLPGGQVPQNMAISGVNVQPTDQVLEAADKGQMVPIGSA